MKVSQNIKIVLLLQGLFWAITFLLLILENRNLDGISKLPFCLYDLEMNLAHELLVYYMYVCGKMDSLYNFSIQALSVA